ncbi:putative Nop domain-containing protein [Helianthus annuus]|nr:putative Nop domain-containing protein [Helianthus annuus]
MSLGLSHSMSIYKLKFSPDKVDTMIIQAIRLLDDLDKELNTYAMRVREWYGWHFPGLAKIVQDNILYAKAVQSWVCLIVCLDIRLSSAQIRLPFFHSLII